MEKRLRNISNLGKNTCLKQTSLKYKSRASPPYHASSCPNEIKDGNDGKKYISKSFKNNSYRWIMYNEGNIKLFISLFDYLNWNIQKENPKKIKLNSYYKKIKESAPYTKFIS